MNVTGLLRHLQVKIETIYLFKIVKKHGNFFKNWLCPNFFLLPKIWGGGGLQLPSLPLPARTPMTVASLPTLSPVFSEGRMAPLHRLKKGLQQTKRYRLKSIKDFELKPLSSWSRKFHKKKGSNLNFSCKIFDVFNDKLNFLFVVVKR